MLRPPCCRPCTSPAAGPATGRDGQQLLELLLWWVGGGGELAVPCRARMPPPRVCRPLPCRRLRQLVYGLDSFSPRSFLRCFLPAVDSRAQENQLAEPLSASRVAGRRPPGICLHCGLWHQQQAQPLPFLETQTRQPSAEPCAPLPPCLHMHMKDRPRRQRALCRSPVCTLHPPFFPFHFFHTMIYSASGAAGERTFKVQ